MSGLKTPALVIAAVAALAQAPSQQPPPPTFRAGANYVRVDVFPTRDGAPVADLTRDDFEIRESGQLQNVEQFEHVVVRSAGPQESRIEPNTVRESRAMLESSRARVFVLFLDTYHVDVAASHRVRKPLVEALDRMLSPDDLIGVMTPEMSPHDIAFARKTTTIDGFLERYWHWGERERMTPIDPEDQEFGFCYPNVQAADKCSDQNGIAAQLIDRRREKRVLDALQDLVRFLQGVREERKAILSLSNGWLLFRPDNTLKRPLACNGVPSGAAIAVDPRSGRPSTSAPTANTVLAKCERDRLQLADIDNDRQFRDILDEANRANASFYPIDPRGLAVFDTPLLRQDVPGAAPPMTPPSVDRAMLTSRLTSLRTLAEATDGLAIVDSNNLTAGFRRVVDDLSAYYLLGYYSNGKLDGRFHPISVKVKRPGVQVRARRGYLAPTLAEAERSARAAAADAPPTPETVAAMAIESVLRPLGAFTRETSLRLRATAGWRADGRTGVWLVGEIGAAETWKAGAEADVALMKNGETLATAHATVPPATRGFKVALTPSTPLEPGNYTIDVRTRAVSMMATSSDSVPLPLPEAPQAFGSVIVRRGPFTGAKEVPTADLRFRRSEMLRVEIPSAGAAAPAARLLDRTGKPMQVPVAAASREDPEGARWSTAQLQLAPLGPGDYIVELTEGSTKTLTPFRVVP